MKKDDRKWFPVKTSKCKDEDGKEYFNVEARFADHPILDVEESRKRRRNVYFYGPVLHKRVLKAADDVRAVKNCTSFVMRFDKGHEEITVRQGIGPQGNTVPIREGNPGMDKRDFDRAAGFIAENWDAWVHYQEFRQSEPTDLEREALLMVAQRAEAGNAHIMVDRQGNMIQIDDGDDDDSEEDAKAFMPEPEQIVKPKRRGGRPRKAA